MNGEEAQKKFRTLEVMGLEYFMQMKANNIGANSNMLNMTRKEALKVQKEA